MARIDALNGRCRLLDLLVQRRPVSDQLPEQPMPGAVPQQDPMAQAGEAGLEIPLGIETAEKQGVPGEQSGKGWEEMDQLSSIFSTDSSSSSSAFCGSRGDNVLPQQDTLARVVTVMRSPQSGQT